MSKKNKDNTKNIKKQTTQKTAEKKPAVNDSEKKEPQKQEIIKDIPKNDTKNLETKKAPKNTINFILFLSIIALTVYLIWQNSKETKSEQEEIDKIILQSSTSQNIENETIMQEIAEEKPQEKVALKSKLELRNFINLEANTTKSEVEQGWLKLNRLETEQNKAQNKLTQSSVIGSAKLKNLIESKQNITDELQTLEQSFNQTNNINHALSLANKHLELKNYSEAIKWCVKANEIDNLNDESWMIFAIASYKLGKKDDAIKALNAYKLENNSTKIENLINQIQGDLI